MGGTADDKSGSWRRTYESCQGRHPPWASKTADSREWVVKDKSQVKIVGLEISGGIYEGDIDLPGCWIKATGNTTLRGNVTAGSLSIG